MFKLVSKLANLDFPFGGALFYFGFGYYVAAALVGACWGTAIFGEFNVGAGFTFEVGGVV